MRRAWPGAPLNPLPGAPRAVPCPPPLPENTGNGANTRTARVLPGPAFYFDLLHNVNASMGQRHSPGPRAGAAVAGFKPTGTDGILFGGLTAVNRTSTRDPGARHGPFVLPVAMRPCHAPMPCARTPASALVALGRYSSNV